jgi:hypothetical protein
MRTSDGCLPPPGGDKNDRQERKKDDHPPAFAKKSVERECRYQ